MSILKKNTALSWIFDRIRGQKRYIGLLILGNLLFAAVVVLFSLGCQGLIDGAVTADFDKIKQYIILLVGLVFLRLLLRLLINSLHEFLHARLMNQIRQDTVHQLLKKEYAAVSAYHSGELVNRLFSDAKIVVDGILGILPPFANMAGRLVGALWILLHLDRNFTLVFLVVGCGIFLVTRLLRKKIKMLHVRVQEEEGRVHATVQETIENIRLVKASDLEEKMEGRLGTAQKAHFRAQMRRRAYSVGANVGMGFLFQMGYLYALIWGAFKISSHAMSYGTLTAILQLVGQIQTPFSGMSGILQKWYGMIASAERLHELCLLSEEPVSVSDADISCGAFKEMHLSHLSFSYDRLDVLKNVDFRIHAGDFVAVTGLSGGGKSTLFLLMLGIYRPTAGDISLTCEDGIRSAGKETRGLFAYVPQGNTLFSGSIRENIAMFSEHPSEEEIWRAAQIACAADFIREMPKGLDTIIGERGIGLSEGQAQRIAVARAVLSGAQILLLDEATSALDAETEKMLLERIAAQKDRTCMIVTHRKAALKVCNRRLHLENGHMIELGEE